MQPKHRRQIPSWVTPARQQCLTFPLVYSCTAETVPGAVRHGRGYGVSQPYILYRSALGTVYWTVRHSTGWGTYTFWACANNACQSRDERSRVTVERPMAVSWSNDEVLRLIHAWGDSTIQAQLEGCKWNQDVHDKIASELLIHLRFPNKHTLSLHATSPPTSAQHSPPSRVWTISPTKFNRPTPICFDWPTSCHLEDNTS